MSQNSGGDPKSYYIKISLSFFILFYITNMDVAFPHNLKRTHRTRQTWLVFKITFKKETVILKSPKQRTKGGQNDKMEFFNFSSLHREIPL